MFVRLSFILLLSASIPCAVLLIVYSRKRRNMPGANYFILLLYSAIIYNSAYIGEISSNEFLWAKFWYDIEHIVIPVQHYLWLMMSFEYVRLHKKYLQKAKYIMLYHPILFILIFFTNNIHHLYTSSLSFESNGFFPVIISVKGPLFIFTVASGTVMGLISTVFYIIAYLKSSRLQHNGYIIMLVASLFPWFTVYLNVSNTNYLGIDYFPVVSIISGVFYVFGIFKFRIFNTIPIATETVFRQSKQGIMLVDLQGYIIDVNVSILKVYPDLYKRTKKCTLSSFLELHPELKDVTVRKLQFPLIVNGETRYYSAETTKIEAEDGLEIGLILGVEDVTLFIENQKRIESIATSAINKAEKSEISFLQAQIKPHFLNNTLSIIGSMVMREPEEAKKLIANLGEYLANCCYFDSTRDMVSIENELETVNTYVSIEKARFRERLNFSIVCEEVPQINIPRLVLQPLVENAISHGILKKAEGGSVWLKIIYEEQKVRFSVQDDGIGMSKEQIISLTEGIIQKRGIGIQNIHKRLIKHYGEGLSISSEKGVGTIVTFSIPDDGKYDGEQVPA